MATNKFEEFAASLGQPAETSFVKNPLEYLKGAALSIPYDTLQGLDTIGQRLGTNVFSDAANWEGFANQEAWKAQNPASNFAAGAVSWLIPGIGWAKATKGAGWAAKAGETFGGKTPLGQYLAADTARWLPFGAAATGLDAAQDKFESPLDAAAALALNTGLGVGLSAVLGKLAPSLVKNYDIPLSAVHQEAARKINLRDLVADFDVYDPWQLQGRKLLGARDSASAEDQPLIDAAIQERRRAALLEEATGVSGYTSFPDGVISAGNFFQRVFKRKSGAAKSSWNSYVLTKDQRIGGSKGVSLEDLAKEAGLPEDFEFKGRYYRYVVPQGQDALKSMDNRVHAYMDRVSPNTWITQEPENGMWLFARRMEPPKGRPRYLFWKTDLPQEFSPEGEAFATAFKSHVAARPIGPLAWNDIERSTAPGGWLFEKARETAKVLPLEDLQSIVRSKDKGTLNRFLDDTVMAKAPGAEAVKDWMQRHTAPALAQFADNARAARLHAIASSAFDEAGAQVRAILSGTGALGPSYASRQIPYATEKGLIGALDDAISGDAGIMDKLHAADIAGQLSADITDPTLRQLVEILQGTAKANIEDHNATMKVVGARQTPVREEHLGVSRGWSGNFMQALRDEGGTITSIAQGNSRAELARHAGRLLERDQAKYPDKSIRIAEPFRQDQIEQAPRDVQRLFGLTRGFQQQRTGIGGFDFDLDPYTRQEFIGLLERNLRTRARLSAQASLDYLLSDDLARLLVEAPASHSALTQRLKLMGGDEGKWSEVQNTMADRILSPIFGGKQWASKIAQTTNRIMLPLQLGAGLVSYPIANLASIAQTVPAEIAYFIHSAPENVSRFYQWFPVVAPGGVKAVGKLNEFEVMGEAMKQLRKPDPVFQEFMERAKFDGTRDPRFIEEWLGETNSRIKDIGQAFKSPGEFVQWLEALSAWPASYTEKKLRDISLSNAYVMLGKLREARGLAPPEAMSAPEREAFYQTMRSFVDRVAYRYAREDRPLVFTTPAGALFGGFKNWMMNYIWTMGRYIGEAGRGNFAPLMWQTAATGAVGGLAATPFLGDTADWFAQLNGQDDLHSALGQSFGDTGADALTYGLPAALGMNLSSQTSSPGSDFAHDVKFLFSIAALDRGINAGRALGSIWNDASVGLDPLQNPKVVTQLMQGFAPRSFYRAIQAYGGEGPRSAGTGYEAFDWPSQLDQHAYALGFTNADVQHTYDVYRRLTKNKEAQSKLVATFGAAFANARSEAEQMEVVRLAVMQGADISAVLRSAQSRQKAAEKDMFERANLPQ